MQCLKDNTTEGFSSAMLFQETILLGQYCTDKNPLQYCLRDSKQHCTGKSLGQCCLNTLGTTLHRSKPYAMLSKRLQTTLHKSKPYVMLTLRFLRTMHRKNSCSVVLILLGQHYRGQNPKQCCPRGSRQLCIRKNLVLCCLNTLGTTLHRSKLYAMLSMRLQTTIHRKKSLSMLF